MNGNPQGGLLDPVLAGLPPEDAYAAGLGQSAGNWMRQYPVPFANAISNLKTWGAPAAGNVIRTGYQLAGQEAPAAVGPIGLALGTLARILQPTPTQTQAQENALLGRR